MHTVRERIQEGGARTRVGCVWCVGCPTSSAARPASASAAASSACDSEVALRHVKKPCDVAPCALHPLSLRLACDNITRDWMDWMSAGTCVEAP